MQQTAVYAAPIMHPAGVSQLVRLLSRGDGMEPPSGAHEPTAGPNQPGRSRRPPHRCRRQLRHHRHTAGMFAAAAGGSLIAKDDDAVIAKTSHQQRLTR